MKKILRQPLLTHLLILFLFALMLRVILASPPTLPVTGDGSEYLELAQNLYQHNTYSYNDGAAVSFRPPLYSFFLSLIFHIFGENMRVVFLFHCLLGALVPLLLAIILLKANLPKRTALLSAFLMAFFNIFIVSTVLTENLYNPLLLASILLLFLYHQAESPSKKLLFLTVVVLTLNTLTRSPAVLLLPAAFIAFKQYKRTMLVAICLLVVISPWSLRCTLLQGHPVLIDTSLGYNLFVAHNPYSHHPPSFTPEFFKATEQFEDWYSLDSHEIKTFSLNYIQEKPLVFLQKIPYKIARLFGAGIAEFTEYKKQNRETPNTVVLLFFLLTYGAEALLTICFLCFLPRIKFTDSLQYFLFSTMMLFIALHGFLFGMPRFRQPLLAIMLAIIILASMQKPKGMQVKAGALLVGLLLVGYLIELRLFWF